MLKIEDDLKVMAYTKMLG